MFTSAAMVCLYVSCSYRLLAGLPLILGLQETDDSYESQLKPTHTKKIVVIAYPA